MGTNTAPRACSGLLVCALVAGGVIVDMISPSALAHAQPGPGVPGNGVFQVGPDMAPGTYYTAGPSTPLVLILGDVAPVSFCSWITYSKPGTNKADIIESNSALGPMYAKVPETVATFETTNCHPWAKVA